MCLPVRLLAALLFVPLAAATPAEELVREATAAESRFEIARALELMLAAEKAGRSDSATLQRIARHYSDLVHETTSRDEQRRLAQRALEYSQRATDLAPQNPVNVLSIAISYGKLALASDTRDKVRYSRLVRSEAERALALDPSYAWAHHVLGRWHREVAELGSASRAIVGLFLGGLPAASVADAVRHLERAVSLEPDELQHHVELGFALRAQGDAPLARVAFQRALALPVKAKIDLEAQARARNALAALLPAPAR